MILLQAAMGMGIVLFVFFCLWLLSIAILYYLIKFLTKKPGLASFMSVAISTVAWASILYVIFLDVVD